MKIEVDNLKHIVRIKNINYLTNVNDMGEKELLLSSQEYLRLQDMMVNQYYD